VHGREGVPGEGRLALDPVLLGHAKRRAEQRLRGGGAEHDDDVGRDGLELAGEPRRAGFHLVARRLVVHAALAAAGELEVLDDVGHVRVAARNPGGGEGVVEHAARRTDERPACEILRVAGLLADQHHARVLAALAEHRLGRVAIEGTSATRRDTGAHRGERVLRRQELASPRHLRRALTLACGRHARLRCIRHAVSPHHGNLRARAPSEERYGERARRRGLGL